MRRPAGTLILLATLVAASGATCVPRPGPQDPLAPAAFVAPPTLDELLAFVSNNTQRVLTLHTDTASLSIPGLPAGMRTAISVQRPQHLRLRGRLLGPEIDLGSNAELVWFWARSDPQRAVYWARHEQLTGASVSSPLPVDAQWFIQALGLVEFSSLDRHEGPFPREDGKLEVHSHIQRAAAEPLAQSVVIDAVYGWVTEQTVWDERGQVLVQIRSSRHRHYPPSNVTLPHHIEVQLPQADLSFQLDISVFLVNALLDDPAELWQMPAFEGYQPIDLASPTGAAIPRPLESEPLHRQPGYEDAERTSFRPRYRGYSTR